MLKIYISGLILAMISFTSFAQVTTSSMRCVVTDDTGQPLPEASVVAVHEPTGTRYGSITNFDGVVNIRNMRVGGPYKITVSYVGFKLRKSIMFS